MGKKLTQEEKLELDKKYNHRELPRLKNHFVYGYKCFI